MEYSRLLQELFSLSQQRGVKFGLENMRRLSHAFSYPEKTFPCIHIAGSNGKGSVATKIAKAYEISGRKTGLYTSPHISTYRERVSINGVLIQENEVIQLMQEILKIAEKEQIPATFFELTTLLAFRLFAEKGVDIAVIETGLGGRFDATNIIHPILSVITSISLEHTDLLGTSLEQIAFEKGGIIKPEIPVILGPNVPWEPIFSIANKHKSPCIQVNDTYSWFDEENKAIAQRALLELKLPRHCLEAGIKVRPACRLEIIEGPPKVILDVAHNPDGLNHLFQAIEQKFPNAALRVVCGLSRNKDLSSCLRMIAKKSKLIHLVESDNFRAAPCKELAALLSRLGHHHEVLKSSIEATLQDALEKGLCRQEIIVICGTFFIMASARKFLGKQDSFDTTPVGEFFKENKSQEKI